MQTTATKDYFIIIALKKNHQIKKKKKLAN